MLIQLAGCRQTYVIADLQNPEAVKTVNFCNLDECQDRDLVSTTAIYSGVEEYWGLSSMTDCRLNHKVYLDTDELDEQKRNGALRRKLQRLHRNYDRYSLNLLITGIYETSSAELAFGHLGLQ